MPFDDVEACLLLIRFVRTGLTGVGDVVCVRKAAAAAADDRLALDGLLARKACAAAVVAAELAELGELAGGRIF